MKYLSLIIMTIWSTLCLGAGVAVISETQEELVLEFTLPEYSITHESINGVTWDSIVSDEGFVHEIDGYPAIRVFGEAIGIPVNGDVSLQVSNIRSTTIRNINLKPVYKLVVKDEEPDYIFYQNSNAYRNSQLYPLEIAKKGESAFIGDRSFVPLQIFPFQYRASTKELVVNTQFTIRVQIAGTKSASPNWQLSNNPIDQAGDSFFLNNQSSKSWRLPKNRDASYQAPKNGITDVNQIQIVADKEGIYKITYNDLNTFINLMTDSLGVSMAWDLDTVDPRLLELTDEYGTVPVYFYGETDGSFDHGDYIEFYGDRHYGDNGYSDDYTAENVYSLYYKGTLGARMAVENGGLVVSNAAQYIVPDAYESSVHFEQQLVIDKLAESWTSSNPDFYREDLWFWRKINAPDLDIIPFELQYPKDSTIRTASVRASIYGLTYAESVGPGQFDHEATIRINEAMINTHSWVGQKEKIFENQSPVANSYFRHGTNYLYISLSGNTVSGTREQVLFDYMDLKYWREYKTDEDKIKFTKPSYRPPGLYQFEVEGFSSNDITVYKVGSSIFNNCQIEPFNLDGLAPWTVTLQDSVASVEVEYYAVTESQKMRPKEFRLDLPTDLKNPGNQADVLLIGQKALVDCEGADILTGLWETEGHAVARIDYQDVFDEFNSGIRSAEAIKDFITYAYNNWSEPSPTHVVLLGEGIDDERDNSPYRKYALVPIKKTWTSQTGATASDGWYATIVGKDLVPDIAVARINAFTEQQVFDYATKADNYRNNPLTNRLWNSHLTISSGGKISDPDDVFAQQSERLRRRNMPEDYRATRVYTSTQTVSNEYFGGTFNLKDAINSGTQYLHFIGHGGGRIWADYNLFNFNDVATLNNQTYPIVVSLACYCSSFDTNGIASISEALVMQANKGAIATLGFSGLGYINQNETWGLAFTEAVFKHDFQTLGEAYQYTLARFFTTSSSLVGKYAQTNAAALLGDPLIKLRKPIGGIAVSADDHVLELGDTLHVHADFPPDVYAARLYVMNNNEITINIPFDIPVINGSFDASYVIPLDIEPPYTNTIYVGGYSATHEYVGRSVFGVGRPALMHHATIPDSPAWTDSVAFITKMYSSEEVISLSCLVRTESTGGGNDWVSLPMIQHNDLPNAFISAAKIPPQTTAEEIEFKYVVTTQSGTYESPVGNFIVRGPDLLLADMQLVTDSDDRSIKILVRNIGDAASTTTDLRLYTRPVGGIQTLFSQQDLVPIGVNQERWEVIPLDGLEPGNLIFEARVNLSNAFPEWQASPTDNNVITLTANYNYHSVGNDGGLLSSLDSNLTCEVPEGLVAEGQTAFFYINSAGYLEASNQPDIHTIRLLSYDTNANSIASNAYEIRTLTPALVDSTDTLINNKKIKLTFFYSANDPEVQGYESENTFKIYRWDEAGNKWILQGGNVSGVDNKVVFEVRRQGIYTIFRNTDRIRPSIDVNVQDQEYTVGGFISGQGTISLLLSDANGIDVFDNTIRMYLNGGLINQDDYVISINLDNVNRIPIKYQLDLSKGVYSLVVDCKDVNGNYNTREVQFEVNETFDVKNVANYPNPILGRANDPKNDGRTRFTYVLTDSADDVTIKVYSVSGRLVKTFSNLPAGVGYHEYPRTVYGWDCKDEYGFTLANGVYFYKLIATKGSKKIVRTIKMAILK